MHLTSHRLGFGIGLPLLLGLAACSPGVDDEEGSASVAPIIGTVLDFDELAAIDRMVESLPTAENELELVCPEATVLGVETHPDVLMRTRPNDVNVVVTRVGGVIRRTAWRVRYPHRVAGRSFQSTALAEYVYDQDRGGVRYARFELLPVIEETASPRPDTPSHYYFLDDGTILRRVADEIAPARDPRGDRRYVKAGDAIRACRSKP
jgi:hypothetical protein